jgi:hypothetical protein
MNTSPPTNEGGMAGIPLGMWHMVGNVIFWTPNDRLSMSRDEQYACNTANGYDCGLREIGFNVRFTA